MRIVIVLLVSGCAALPPCQKPSAAIVETPKGPLIVFTAQELGKLQHRMEGIRDGKCDPDKDPDAI